MPHSTLPGGGPSRSSARGKEVRAPPAADCVPDPRDGPHLKPAASPVPRPLGGASVLTLATARAPRGFTCRGGAPGAEAKVCARLGPREKLSRGPGRRALARGAGHGGSRPRLAARGAGGAAPRARGPGGLTRRRQGRGKSPASRLEPAACALRGSPPCSVAPRGCPGRGVAGALLVRHAGPQEAAARGAGRREWSLGQQGRGWRRNK